MPINISGGPEQFWRDAMCTEVKYIMVLEPDVVRLGLREPWVAAAGIAVLVVLEN
jgi:hypothetical protein